MDNTQSMQCGKTWQELFQAIKAGTFKRCLKKSQRPTFQCLIAEDKYILIGSKYGLSAGMLEEIEIAQKCGTVELAQSKAGLIEVYNGGQQL